MPRFQDKRTFELLCEDLHIGTHDHQWIEQGEKLSEFVMATKTIHGNLQFRSPPLYAGPLRLKRSWRSWTTKTSTTTPHIRKFRELYRFLFTIKPYPLYNDVTTSKEGATFENAKRVLKWNNMGVEVDGWHFAYDILLMTSTIYQAEPMLVEFDTTCEKIGLLLNLEKAIYMRNGWVGKINMMNDLVSELSRDKRAVWGAYKNIEDVVKRTKKIRFRAHLFNTTGFPALTHASETWACRKQEDIAISIIEPAIERVLLGISRFTRIKEGIRSSFLHQRSKIGDDKTIVLVPFQTKAQLLDACLAGGWGCFDLSGRNIFHVCEVFP
ncbi:hypothetical protein RB195_017773 [Necator americanus]|uniref:Uncharacterized protein n=1 Tax=Necator americanus TaxID=51031 RepID=A0ABR1C9M8_NECAM